MAETWSGEFYCVKCKEKREAEGEIQRQRQGHQDGQGRLPGLRHQPEPHPRQGLRASALELIAAASPFGWRRRLHLPLWRAVDDGPRPSPSWHRRRHAHAHVPSLVRRPAARAARLPARLARARGRRARRRGGRARSRRRGRDQRGPGTPGLGHGRRLVRRLAAPPAGRRAALRRRGRPWVAPGVGPCGGAWPPRCSTTAHRAATGSRCRGRCSPWPPAAVARDLAAWSRGELPLTWLTSWRVDHEPLPRGATLAAPPLLRLRLVRHRLSRRRLIGAGHHHSLSSLLSIARRWVREQVSQ